jgi:hypothetical protein
MDNSSSCKWWLTPVVAAGVFVLARLKHEQKQPIMQNTGKPLPVWLIPAIAVSGLVTIGGIALAIAKTRPADNGTVGLINGTTLTTEPTAAEITAIPAEQPLLRPKITTRPTAEVSPFALELLRAQQNR